MVVHVQLTYLSGPADGSVAPFVFQDSNAEVVFGRVPACSVALPYDLSVSRRHARLYSQENAWWLEDSGSSNGTFVGEFSQAVKVSAPVRLSVGQVFQVGRTRFRLESAEQRSTATVATAQVVAD